MIKIEPEDIDMNDEEVPKEHEENNEERDSPIILTNNVIKMETDENDLHNNSAENISPKIASRNNSPVASSILQINSTTPPIELLNDPKYCSNCDISFTYTHTFIAHKKFYCKSKNGEAKIQSPSPTPNSTSNGVNVTLAAEASIL